MEDMALKDRTAISLPDAYSYNHVMVAMTRNMNEETPEKMLKLVDRMEQRDKELRSQSKEHLLNTIGKQACIRYAENDPSQRIKQCSFI